MTSTEFAAWIERQELDRDGAAEVLGCSPRSVYRYLKGTRRVPTPIRLLCDAIDRGATTGLSHTHTREE